MKFSVDGYAIARDQFGGRVDDFAFDAKPWLEQASEKKLRELRSSSYAGNTAREVYQWTLENRPTIEVRTDMRDWHAEMVGERNHISVVINSNEAELFIRNRLYIKNVANTAVSKLMGGEP